MWWMSGGVDVRCGGCPLWWMSGVVNVWCAGCPILHAVWWMSGVVDVVQSKLSQFSLHDEGSSTDIDDFQQNSEMY